jgi:glycosyltransferase involved in cell wall biosynthesis
MNRRAAIDIVVPSYNCSDWLDALFESVAGQDFTDWHIIARDDASMDCTGAVLARWKNRLGAQLTILEDSGKSNLGMIGNYDAVLARTTSPWVMLADPDDVWLPGKISITLKAMRRAEQSGAGGVPIVVCSDATVIDENLNTVASSYKDWSRHNVNLLHVFHRMIVESSVLTSTMMVNRALLDAALPLAGASCPDWWLALVACAFGQIVHLPQSTILYRRHSANDSLEPLTSSLPSAARRFTQAKSRVDRLVRQYASQAGEFRRRFESRLSRADVAALRAAEELPLLGHIDRRRTVIRHDLWFASPLKNVGLMLFL